MTFRMVLFLPALTAALTAAFISCASYPKVGMSDHGGRVLGLWEESGQTRGVLLEDKDYYVISENAKNGPYSWMRPAKMKGARCYSYQKEGNNYLTDGAQTFGPYRYIEQRTPAEYPRGKIYSCTREDRKYDLYYDNGAVLTALGTVTDEYATLYGVHASADGKHSAVEVKSGNGKDSGVLFDQAVIPYSSPGKYIPSVLGFVGGTYWFLPCTRDNKFNLVMLTKNSDKAVLPEIRVLLTSETKIEALLSSNSTGYEQISHVAGYVKSPDGNALALRYETDRGTFIYTGSRKFGPFKSKDRDKRKDMEFSSDGKSIVYSFESDGKIFIGKDDERFGPYEKAENPHFLEGTKDLFYIAAVGGKEWAFLNGKKISGPWDSAKIKPVSFRSVSERGRIESKNIYDGYFMAANGGKTWLCRLADQVAGPFDGDSFYSYLARSGEGDSFKLEIKSKDMKKIPSIILGKRTFDLSAWGSLVHPEFTPRGKQFLFQYDLTADTGNFILMNGSRLGPYDRRSAQSFYSDRNEFAFLFEKGGAPYLGWSNGRTVPIPVLKYENIDSSSLSLSSDGRIAQFSIINKVLDTSAGNADTWLDLDTSCVLIDGALYVGSHDPKTGVTVYWDEKERKIKKVSLK